VEEFLSIISVIHNLFIFAIISVFSRSYKTLFYTSALSRELCLLSAGSPWQNVTREKGDGAPKVKGGGMRCVHGSSVVAKFLHFPVK
jgi:hypothetical protein